MTLYPGAYLLVRLELQATIISHLVHHTTPTVAAIAISKSVESRSESRQLNLTLPRDAERHNNDDANRSLLKPLSASLSLLRLP